MRKCVCNKAEQLVCMIREFEYTDSGTPNITFKGNFNTEEEMQNFSSFVISYLMENGHVYDSADGVIDIRFPKYTKSLSLEFTGVNLDDESYTELRCHILKFIAAELDTREDSTIIHQCDEMLSKLSKGEIECNISSDSYEHIKQIVGSNVEVVA